MSDSFVEVDSARLRKVCETGLAYVHLIREEALGELVDKAMSKRFFKPKNREEARNKIMEDSCTDPFFITLYEKVMWKGASLERVCKALLGMSHLNSSVFLSRKDYETISLFVEEGMTISGEKL